MSERMNPLVRANAVNLINKYFFESPLELDLENLLYAEGLFLMEERLDNCEGKIIFDNQNGIITINTENKDVKQRRFTIAHEMGHFFNERNTSSINGHISYRCSYNELYGVNRRYKREGEANQFAAELLMYDKWFKEFFNGKTLSLSVLQSAVEYFNVSLSAISFRYAEIGNYPAAVVVSKDRIIKWSIINKEFPFKYIPWNTNVSNLSYVYDIFEGKDYPKDAEDIPIEAWFSHCNNYTKHKTVFELNCNASVGNGIC